MRTIHFAVLASLASAAAAPALAEDVIHITPPLYREQARATAIRPAAERTVTPQPVAAAPAGSRVVAEVASAAR